MLLVIKSLFIESQTIYPPPPSPPRQFAPNNNIILGEHSFPYSKLTVYFPLGGSQKTFHATLTKTVTVY